MVSTHQLFTAEQSALTAALAGDRDPTAAIDAARACIDRVQQGFIALEEDRAARTAAMPLFAIAHSAAGILAAADNAQVQIEIAPPTPTSMLDARVFGLPKRLTHYLPLILCVLTSVMLFALGNTFMILLSLAATISVGWQTLRAKPSRAPNAPAPIPQASAQVQVDPKLLISALDHVFISIDRVLAAQAERAALDVAQPVWSATQLAAVQTLWEAVQAQNGAYALKAVPALLDALEQQDLRLETYTPETALHFETIPGAQAGITIRPALFVGSKLLARGQVTIPLRPVAVKEGSR